MARPKKSTIKCQTNEIHEYVMCRQSEDYNKGKHIKTKFDMDLCEDLDEFLTVLFDNNEISETELNEVMSVYYKK